ncbi:MAG: hypothetical protein ABSH44_24025 [Bryobacteraceae bacterium]|jgi:hypothetical protein
MKRVILLVLVLSAVAAAQTTCTLNSVAGTYAVSYIGWVTMVLPDAAPVMFSGTIVGVISIGWDGKLSGGAAVSGLGPVADYDISGTAEIKSDCTGTLRMKSKPRAGGAAEPETDRFVFISSDRTLFATVVDLGPGMYPAMAGTWKQISPVPNTATW